MRDPDERARPAPSRPTPGTATFSAARGVHLGVEPAELERDLRACLAQQAARTAPPAGSRSDEIIRKGNRILRRRAMGGAVALVVATALATLGAAEMGIGPRSAPSLSSLMAEPVLPTGEPGPPGGTRSDQPSSVSTPRTRLGLGELPVEVVTPRRLVPMAGPPIDLKPVAPVGAAYSVTGGWLVTAGTPPAATSLWYVRAAGSRIGLLSDVDGLALSGDGTRVAWRKDQRLLLAGFAGGVLSTRAVSPADGGLPVGFAGEQVLLRRPLDTGGTEIGVWAGSAAAMPTWRAEASAAYGTLPDRRTVVARLADRGGPRGQKGCLGLLDATRSLAVRQRACGLPLSSVGPGWVSPDGHWLVAGAGNGRAVVVDLTTAFEAKPTARDAGPAPNGPAVWADSQTLVHGEGQQLVRLRLAELADGDAAGVESIALSGLGPSERAQVVPHLGG